MCSLSFVYDHVGPLRHRAGLEEVAKGLHESRVVHDIDAAEDVLRQAGVATARQEALHLHTRDAALAVLAQVHPALPGRPEPLPQAVPQVPEAPVCLYRCIDV